MRLSLLLENIPFEIERALCSRLNKALGRRPSSAPFLSGDTYRSLADAVHDETGDLDPSRLRSGAIVFVGASRIGEFEAAILPKITVPFVLITHQGDQTISKDFAALADSEKIIHWFAQNCVLEHPKVIPLPIGLEDRRRHNNGEISHFRRLSKNRPFRPRIAYSFNLGTNLERRLECYRRLKKCGFADELEQPLNSRLYRNLVKEYMLVASPPGNGPDCHRTWEAMYMNSVPIVENNSMNRYFKSLGLPMLLIDEWAEIGSWDERTIIESYRECREKHVPEALYDEYWEKRFNSFAKGENAI